jgi:hypothetical protein
LKKEGIFYPAEVFFRRFFPKRNDKREIAETELSCMCSVRNPFVLSFALRQNERTKEKLKAAEPMPEDHPSPSASPLLHKEGNERGGLCRDYVAPQTAFACPPNLLGRVLDLCDAIISGGIGSEANYIPQLKYQDHRINRPGRSFDVVLLQGSCKGSCRIRPHEQQGGSSWRVCDVLDNRMSMRYRTLFLSA